MPKKSHRVFHTRSSFKKEFKRQLKFALIAAIGFTIALAWRDSIRKISSSVIETFLNITGSALSEIYIALFITIIGVIIILITSKTLK